MRASYVNVLFNISAKSLITVSAMTDRSVSPRLFKEMLWNASKLFEYEGIFSEYMCTLVF